MTPPTTPQLDFADIVSLASLEKSFQAPLRMPKSEAVMAKIYLLRASEDDSRILLLLGDLRALRKGSGSDAGALASALATRARACLLQAGAMPPPAAFDDYPSSPLMASSDVCSCSAAVCWPESIDLHALLAACEDCLTSMFLIGGSFSRHIKLSESGSGRLEKAANHLILDLRAARTRR